MDPRIDPRSAQFAVAASGTRAEQQRQFLAFRVALRIARKESWSLLHEGRLLLAIALVTILLVAAIVVAEQRQTIAVTDRIEAEQRSRTQWESHDNVDPHSAAHYGIWVYKPVSPLAVLDPGLDPYVGVSAHLVAHSGSTPQNAPILADNRYARWAEPTAAANHIVAIGSTA